MAADPDAEARLLDGIAGKYGEDGDYGDLGNADEDALLEGYDDPDFIKDDELDHEPEEPEDVLDIIAPDVDLDEEEEDKSNVSYAATVSSTTHCELDTNTYSQSNIEEKRCEKFKSERQGPSKARAIPDSLDNIPVATNLPRTNTKNFKGQIRGRFANQRKTQAKDSKTVLINPHFKGQVHINNDARLAWDARHRINQNKSQIQRVEPFHNRLPSNPPPQPWVNNLPQNVHQFQPPPPAYQPQFQQQQPLPPPATHPSWNQYQPNSFNQVPLQPQAQQHPSQHVFMQPLPPPQTIYNSQPPAPPPQYNSQPTQQFNNHIPVFQPPPQPPMYNQQFGSPPNAFNQSPEVNYQAGFPPNQNPMYQQPSNNFIPPPTYPVQGSRFIDNRPNQFRGQQQRFGNKPNFNPRKQFNHKTSPGKRKVDASVDLRKKKRNAGNSSNLHEVATVETPDTTVEDKPPEDEDEETKIYRKKIEEQTKLREEILKRKELRRQQAAQKLKESDSTLSVISDVQPVPEQPLIPQQKPLQQPHQRRQPLQRPQHQQPKFRSLPQRNLQVVCISQDAGPSNNNSPNLFPQQSPLNRNIKVINTTGEDASVDKQHLTSFLSNRKILTKDQSLIDTSIVVVSNLSAGTTDIKLRKLCQGIGEVKKLQMAPKERQATIQFNSVASAHAFFKKHQRTMLDLSMIQVELKPMS